MFTSELRDRVLIRHEGDCDLYLVRAWHADDPPFEPRSGDPAGACIQPLRRGGLADLWRAIVVRAVSRLVLTLRSPRGEPLPFDVDPDVDEPAHVLSITSADAFEVDLGETVTITADGAPPGTYAWSIESGPGSLRGATTTPTARVHCDGPGSVVVLVEHTWAGDVKRARATVMVHQYVWRWDAPHDTPHDRYVNLPRAWEPACNGREVELVGHIERRTAAKTARFNAIPNPDNEPDTVAATADA